MSDSLIIPTTVVLIASVVATITDVTRFKVSNLLTIPLLLSGLIYHGLVGGSVGVAESLLGSVIGAGILFVFFLIGGMGAGDVKFAGAVGAWLGLPLTLKLLVASALAAGLYAVVLVLFYGSLRETWVNLRILWQRLVRLSRYLGADDRIETEVTRSDRRQRLIPFAAMMTVGLVVLLLMSWAQRP